MKRSIIPLILSFLVFSACGNKDDQSDAYGNFEVVDVLVSAEGQGKLIAFNVKEGAMIESGLVVGIIDTIQLHLKKLQLIAGIRVVQTKTRTLNAQIGSIKVQLKNIEREMTRVNKLLEDGAATTKQKDDIEGNIELLGSQIAALETQRATISAEQGALRIQIIQLDDQITKSSISNPIDGIVLQKYKEQGEIVAPGMTLYKIANLDELILRAYVSGDQLSQVEIGKEVTIKIDGAEGIEELPGFVTWVSSQAEFTPKIIQTREERINLVYAIKVSVKNDGRLKIGMPAELDF